uniref:Uncharacterized protein n=1 Tax=Latimeria chalumnae TaxID=7897 RepID=H3AME4_LATCH
KALERLNSHEESNLHSAASHALAAVEAGVNIVAACSQGKQKQMQEARRALLTVLSSLQYLACQGHAICGHVDEEANLNQLLTLCADDIPELKSWLNCTTYKWISHDIINEMLSIMAYNVLHTLMKEIHEAVFYAIIVDKTTDISVREQVSFCFRIVKEDLVRRFLFGFYTTGDTTACNHFYHSERFYLSTDKCRGQCYDGAANVAGHRCGLQALVQEEEPRAVFVHCLAHTLNLVVQDVAQSIGMCRTFLSLIGDLITLVKASPKCLVWFEKFQQEEDKVHLHEFCPTRWTLRASSLQSVASNYSELNEFLNDLSSQDRSDAGAKPSGYMFHLQKFETYFTLQLLLLVFSRVESVATALQRSNLQFHQAEMVITSLKSYYCHPLGCSFFSLIL